MIKNINIYVTERCNLACKYCFVSENLEDIKLEKIKLALVDIINNHSWKILTINFFGGETLLKVHMIQKLVDYIKKKNFKKLIQFNLSTNGLLVTKSLISWSKKNNVHILLSFDGNKKSHDKNRVFNNGKGSFDLAHKNLLLLIKELDKRLIVRMTLEPTTVKDFYNNILFFYSIGVKKVAYSFVFEKKWSKTHLKILSRELNKIFSFWLKNIKTDKRIWIQPLQEFVKSKVYPKNKTNLFAHKCNDERISISCAGDVYPCHRFTALKKKKIGSIENGKFVLDSKQFKNYLREKNELFSRYPNSGGCPAINLDLCKSIGKPAKSFNDLNRIHITSLDLFWKKLNYQDKTYLKKLFKMLNKRKLY
jgi:uncharacterized protein